MKFWGLIFLSVGTMIGAAVLTLPLQVAPYGWMPTLIAMSLLCFYSYFASLFTIEINSVTRNAKSAEVSSVASLSSQYIGKAAGTISLFCTGGLLLSLLSAYMSGFASLFHVLLPMIPHSILVFSIAGLFIALILLRIFDISNKIIFICKLFFFSMLVLFCKEKVSCISLASHGAGECSPLMIALVAPMFLTAFGFHGSIPYFMKFNLTIKKLQSVFWISSIIACCVYLIWTFVVLSSLDASQIAGAKTVGDLISRLGYGAVSEIAGTEAVHATGLFTWFTDGFIFTGIFTSMIGVGVSLLDFLEEKCSKMCKSRNILCILTFLLPALLVIIAPSLFVQFLSFAALCLLIIAVILPTIIAYKQRYILKLTQKYQVPGRRLALMIILLIGIAFAAIDVYTILCI